MRSLALQCILFVSIISTAYAQPPDTLWARTFGSEEDDIGKYVRQTNDGGYIVVGTMGYQYGVVGDVYLIKTNTYGDTMWTRTYGGVDNEDGECVQLTSDGGYIICGTTSSYGAGGADAYVIKTSDLGDTLWTKTYGGEGTEEAYYIQQTSDGGYIFIGFSTSCVG